MTSKRKYRLTDETKTLPNGTVLHRIEALRDIPSYGVKSGDRGGWLESESNLSQEGDAWVSDNAKVYGKAEVYGNAWVYGDTYIYNNARVYDNARIYGGARVRGNAKVYDRAWILGDTDVFGYARVYGNAQVYGHADVCEDAKIGQTSDYMTFKNFWSSNRTVTYTRSNRMWRAGCFYGTGEELVAKAYKDSELSGRCYEAMVRCVENAYADTERSQMPYKEGDSEKN